MIADCFLLLSGQGYDCSSDSSEYRLPNDLKLIVHLQDILRVKADAVVTGESPDLSVMSIITEKLCEMGGIRYSVWRDTLLNEHRMLKFGKVYDIPMTITDLPFRHSFHAIMHPYQHGEDLKWASHMDEIYSNIVRKADQKSTKSIVMPLLGSG